MRKSSAALWLVAATCGLALMFPPAVLAAAPPKSDVVLSHITVTAGKVRGDSAVSMSITNNAKGPISLVSVSSPETNSSMIDYDTNMCQGNHAMMELSNILITGGHTQQLGYKYQGAMLRRLKETFVKGETVPVVITWSNFQKVHSVTIEAKVVASPRHLYFGMATMKM